MQAVTFQGKESVQVKSVPEPVLQAPTDVVVGVHLAAICGSDLHAYHEREKGLDRDTVLGHEFVGEVLAAGGEVETLRPGDRVFGPFTTSCGACFYCQQGWTCRCTEGELLGWVEKGAGLHGTQAEQLRVPLADSTLLKLPGDLLPEEGLLLGDVLSTGFFCADMAGVVTGGTYAVVGCGPVGLMAVVGARERGAGEIYAIDSIGERLELARRLGAVPVDRSQEDPVACIRGRTDGRGADAVLEAVGNRSAGRLAVDLVRPAGTVAAAGVHNEDAFAFAPIEAYDKNLTYRTGRCPARRYMEELLPLVQSKKYDLTSVFSHRLPLAEGREAYRMFAARVEGCTKILLDPAG